MCNVNFCSVPYKRIEVKGKRAYRARKRTGLGPHRAKRAARRLLHSIFLLSRERNFITPLEIEAPSKTQISATSIRCPTVVCGRYLRLSTAQCIRQNETTAFRSQFQAFPTSCAPYPSYHIAFFIEKQLKLPFLKLKRPQKRTYHRHLSDDPNQYQTLFAPQLT